MDIDFHPHASKIMGNTQKFPTNLLGQHSYTETSWSKPWIETCLSVPPFREKKNIVVPSRERGHQYPMFTGIFLELSSTGLDRRLLQGEYVIVRRRVLPPVKTQVLFPTNSESFPWYFSLGSTGTSVSFNQIKSKLAALPMGNTY